MRAPTCTNIGIAALVALCASEPASSRQASGTPSPISGNSTAVEQPARGHVIAPRSGDRLVYCGRPLTITVKVDATTAPGTRLVAGTGELHGDEGTATHPEGDEVLYVVRGSGQALLGNVGVSLAAGSVAFVPENTPHRLVSTGKEPMEYLWVLAPRSSTESFRSAAKVGCGADALAVNPIEALPLKNAASNAIAASDSGGSGVTAVPFGAGERLVYCELPLVLTLKVESGTSPMARLRASLGLLSKGDERGVHRDGDEVLYVVRGRGKAIIGDQPIAIEPGSIMFVPQGTPHGLSNESEEPLEYFVVHSPQASAEGFRRRAAVPGPYCAGRGIDLQPGSRVSVR